MSSFPLTVWKTFRGEQAEVTNAEEYQPLANDPSAPEPPEPAQMGADEQMPKPETRRGDRLAEWAAYVRPHLDLVLEPCSSLLGIHCSTSHMLAHRSGPLTVNCCSSQIFLTTTWLMALNSHPSFPFTFHPILQSLGVSSFAWGEVLSQFLSVPQRLSLDSQGS